MMGPFAWALSVVSILSIVFKKWRGAFDATPQPGNAKNAQSE